MNVDTPMPAIKLQAAPRRLGVPGWAYGVVGLWLALVGLHQWVWPAGAAGGSLCTFRRISGVPCPTCGSTRAFLAAGRGEFAEAVLYNPFVAVATIGMLGWIVLRIGLGRTIAISTSPSLRYVLWTMIGTLFLVNWVYVIVRDLRY